MLRANKILKVRSLLSTTPQRTLSSEKNPSSTPPQLPASAEAVIIGGGSAGCHALYHLAKRGVKAVLLERAKLTAGTTWHTAGLVWRLRPNDVEIELLASSRNLLMSLEKETGLDPGWIMNGGLFIAHSDVRLDEYKRLATIGKRFGVESHVMTPLEAQKVFPLLDPTSFTGALYSPGDGVVDPAMLCTALTRAATKNGGKVFEEVPVMDLEVGQNILGHPDVRGVVTPFGTIKTNTVINATGVWGEHIGEKYGIKLPLIPMKHAYVVSETIPGVQGMPNVRDHDFSMYFRIQGQSICMGGYEGNPLLLDRVPDDFHFGLYDLDWSVFETHIKGAIKLCPEFGKRGIKSTVCGPESFTPDHKPLMGPDPRLDGLFHSCGFNSAGMMLGGGCAEQLAEWVISGRPSLHMFNYDIARYTERQRTDREWAVERSHESYAKNYSIVFPNDQPLAGRNFTKDPLHEELIADGAVMEEKQGWERPGYYLKGEKTIVQPYDWYADHGDAVRDPAVTKYEELLKKEYRFGFSENHQLIGKEANECRTNAVLYNMSYFAKMYLTGSQAEEAANWLFTGVTNKGGNKTVYTCALNNKGGVEADVTIGAIESGSGGVHDPKIKGRGYYIVAGGASAFHTYNHLRQSIKEKAIQADVQDVTGEMGVISIQGPNSRNILQRITDFELSNENLQPNCNAVINVKTPEGDKSVRILRVSFVGELGYELHVPKDYSALVHRSLMSAGKPENLINAGYRSLYALSSEKGYHLWGFDLRSDDTPIESNLGFTCRKTGEYKGKAAVDKQRAEGINKRLAFFTLEEQVPLWGLEIVYRNGEIVGHIRRGDYGYTLQKPIGQSYVTRPDGQKMDEEFLKTGKYEIEIMGVRYPATCHLRSPFDPKGKRVLGIYE